jgi:hypothetical protein
VLGVDELEQAAPNSTDTRIAVSLSFTTALRPVGPPASVYADGVMSVWVVAASGVAPGS